MAIQRFGRVKLAYSRKHALWLQQCGIRIQQFCKAWASQYRYRCVELAWWERRIGAALLLQRNARCHLSGRQVHQRRLLRHAISIQSCCRCVICTSPWSRWGTAELGLHRLGAGGMGGMCVHCVTPERAPARRHMRVCDEAPPHFFKHVPGILKRTPELTTTRSHCISS